ncbi:hypothetical protein EV356DRAFT_310356 [Viridothelium virens]|uniref:Transcription factor domain-containing protein n=1 Tax=Viridothelium virens TaxID=1048519 RepID=A0A6A6GZA1_VIRVR|nr:hypothetical protein EV356DRAFT_310356 [Viridothelium virens]
MPVVDPSISPDDYYTLYPFIFWAAVAVGSRRYTKDATLLLSLAPKVTQLALESLKEPKGRTVQGLALLVTWPLPTDVSSKDLSFTLSAALVHIAIRVGLHMPRSIQDFHRTRVELSERKIVIRSEAWIRCLLVYQRASFIYGSAPSAWVASTCDAQWKHALSELLNPSLLFQFKLHRLQAQANTAIDENGCDMPSAEQKRAFCIILKIFDRQIKDLEDDNPWIDDLDKFHIVMTRLQVVGLHLFRPFEEIGMNELMLIYNTACMVMTFLHKCDRTIHLISVCPEYIMSNIMLAGCMLLRILKSDFAQYLDEKEGKAFFLDSVSTLKLMSCANNDMPARISQILSQLWTSEKVFKSQDGSPYLTLRIRSRFATSIALDCVWWWREEFGGQPGVYPKGAGLSTCKSVYCSPFRGF